jgi:hypothetical protein
MPIPFAVILLPPVVLLVLAKGSREGRLGSGFGLVFFVSLLLLRGAQARTSATVVCYNGATSLRNAQLALIGNVHQDVSERNAAELAKTFAGDVVVLEGKKAGKIVPCKVGDHKFKRRGKKRKPKNPTCVGGDTYDSEEANDLLVSLMKTAETAMIRNLADYSPPMVEAFKGLADTIEHTHRRLNNNGLNFDPLSPKIIKTLYQKFLEYRRDNKPRKAIVELLEIPQGKLTEWLVQLCQIVKTPELLLADPTIKLTIGSYARLILGDEHSAEAILTHVKTQVSDVQSQVTGGITHSKMGASVEPRNEIALGVLNTQGCLGLEESKRCALSMGAAHFAEAEIQKILSSDLEISADQLVRVIKADGPHRPLLDAIPEKVPYCIAMAHLTQGGGIQTLQAAPFPHQAEL